MGVGNVLVYMRKEAITAPPGKSEREGLLCIKVVATDHPGLFRQTGSLAEYTPSDCLGGILLGNT